MPVVIAYSVYCMCDYPVGPSKGGSSGLGTINWTIRYSFEIQVQDFVQWYSVHEHKHTPSRWDQNDHTEAFLVSLGANTSGTTDENHLAP